MKNILKKIISKNLFVLYYKLRKKIRIIPKDEKVKFDSSTISDGHLKVTYRGVSACRCPFDYCIYQMIHFKIKPDLVIEIGTSHGGGALYIADLMNIIGHGIVHSIDIEKKTEDLVNEAIQEDLPVQFVELPKEEAEKTGALYFFKEKYPPKVKVYYAGHSLQDAFSKEFCGGPHVTHTLEIGKFKIAKEEAVGSGVRRIRGKL